MLVPAILITCLDQNSHQQTSYFKPQIEMPKVAQSTFNFKPFKCLQHILRS
jgi:hypothetical protein